MTNYNAPLGGGSLPVRSGGAPVFSAFSIIAIICAVAAMFVNSGLLTLLLAAGAVIFGLLGLAVAFLPSRRGGIMSFFAIGVGLIAVIIAVIRLISHAGGNPPAAY